MMIKATRREFLSRGSRVAMAGIACGVAPGLGWRSVDAMAAPQKSRGITDDRAALKALLARAVDAARAAGASYADVRMTQTIERRGQVIFIRDKETIHIGVRALVDGYWGFASGPELNADEAARLGREAVRQARANCLGQIRAVELAPTPVIDDEHWETPVAIDPLSVHPLEVQDYLYAINMSVRRDAKPQPFEMLQVAAGFIFLVQDYAFAATSGSFLTQKIIRTTGSVRLQLRGSRRSPMDTNQRTVPGLSIARAGWEHIKRHPIRPMALELVEDMRRDFTLPVNPVDVGRDDVVLDVATVAPLVGLTIGAATEADRVFGYEANAGGTSYLNDPLAMLGSFPISAPLLTVDANRTEAGGAATVKWDHEGVTPQDFTLVRDGVVEELLTTRESAAWIKSETRAFRSLGCASAPTALEVPLANIPNLVVAPAKSDAGVRELVHDLGKGVEFCDSDIETDHQLTSGWVRGRAYQIKGGKRIARLANASILFKTSELWKSLAKMGGASSSRRVAVKATKGQPEQSHYFSVTAVPIVCKDVAVVDMKRRA